ncbi:Sua5/YciO/YrdC/YwlC family protein [Gammaproteobacteria bacterium]|nr:Sua5/YciO/YrdC/YwlC family protein [Gammaproteobacteria bacterium]
MTISPELALQYLNQDQLIIYPTDTVYGIGCRADSEVAIEKLMKIKPRSQGFIILSTNWQNCTKWIDCNIDPNSLIKPKPTTWIFPASRLVSKHLCNPEHEIAIRITQHEPTASLISKLNCPIVSTSANLPGMPTPKDVKGLAHLSLPIMQGNNGNYPPSQIIHFLKKNIIRD